MRKKVWYVARHSFLHSFNLSLTHSLNSLNHSFIHLFILEIWVCLTRSWSVGTALILDTQNPEILGFSTAHAYEYTQAKAKTASKKYIFVGQSTFLSERYSSEYRS